MEKVAVDVHFVYRRLVAVHSVQDQQIQERVWLRGLQAPLDYRDSPESCSHEEKKTKQSIITHTQHTYHIPIHAAHHPHGNVHTKQQAWTTHLAPPHTHLAPPPHREPTRNPTRNKTTHTHTHNYRAWGGDGFRSNLSTKSVLGGDGCGDKFATQRAALVGFAQSKK